MSNLGGDVASLVFSPLSQTVDNTTVPQALMAALENDDSPLSYGRAFHAASLIPNVDLTDLFDQIEDVVAQADETPTTLYVRNGYSIALPACVFTVLSCCPVRRRSKGHIDGCNWDLCPCCPHRKCSSTHRGQTISPLYSMGWKVHKRLQGLYCYLNQNIQKERKLWASARHFLIRKPVLPIWNFLPMTKNCLNWRVDNQRYRSFYRKSTVHCM